MGKNDTIWLKVQRKEKEREREWESTSIGGNGDTWSLSSGKAAHKNCHWRVPVADRKKRDGWSAALCMCADLTSGFVEATEDRQRGKEWKGWRDVYSLRLQCRRLSLESCAGWSYWSELKIRRRCSWRWCQRLLKLLETWRMCAGGWSFRPSEWVLES